MVPISATTGSFVWLPINACAPNTPNRHTATKKQKQITMAFPAMRLACSRSLRPRLCASRELVAIPTPTINAMINVWIG